MKKLHRATSTRSLDPANFRSPTLGRTDPECGKGWNVKCVSGDNHRMPRNEIDRLYWVRKFCQIKSYVVFANVIDLEQLPEFTFSSYK